MSMPGTWPSTSRIEPVFLQVKDQEGPPRSHTNRSGLREAVARGFDGDRRKLRAKPSGQLRPAA